MAAFQIYLVFSSYGIQWLKAAWRTRNVEAETRSARFLLGRRAANYLQFLEDQVPESVPVVLPYRVGEFSRQSLLQFFLMPRDIPGCGCEGTQLDEVSAACVQCLRREDLAVPAIGEFPPQGAMAGAKSLVQHDEDTGWFHGVYLADGIASASGQAVGIAEVSVPLAIPLDALIFGGMFLLGALTIGVTARDPNWGDILSSAIPLGLGLWTMALFLAGWAGIAISRSSVLITLTLLAGALGWLRYRKAGTVSPFPSIRVRRPKPEFSRSQSVWSFALLCVVVLAIAAAVISVGRGYSTVDGITNWAIKGYAIAQEGSIFAGENWGNHGLAYPQNLHLAVALFRVMDGDVLPGSKLVFPLLTLSLIVGSYVFWRRAGVPRALSSLATLALASLPLLFYHSTIGFANAPFTAYLVLGILHVAHGALSERRSSLVLGSLMLGFAAWTRPEGVGYSFIILISLVVGSWLLRRRVFSLAAASIPLLSISAIWLAFGSRYVAEDEVGRLLERFVPAVLAGDIRLGPLSTVVRYAAEDALRFQSWGLLLVAVPVLAVIGLSRGRRSWNTMAILVGLAGFVALAIPLAIFYIAGYAPGYSVGFLDASFERAMLPAAIALLWSAVALALGRERIANSRLGAA
ncbi:MAG: hypothetical protein ACC700_10100 [Anaerolineales bacterium]